MGLGVVGFGGFEEDREEGEEGEREWVEGSESVVFGRVGEMGVVEEEREEEEEITPVMRVLDELGSSIEFSGGSTIGAGSVGFDEGVGQVDIAGGGDSVTLAESGAQQRKVSSTHFNGPSPSHSRSHPPPSSHTQPRTYSPAHSELLRIHQRHSSSHSSRAHSVTSSPTSSPKTRLKQIESKRDSRRKEETAELKRRTRVMSGAVGALVLAVAGWRIFGGGAGGGVDGAAGGRGDL